MKATVIIIIILALSNFSLVAQETSPSPTAAKAPPPDLPVTSTVMRTNSMTVLDDKKRLGSNDYVSFRVVEDRDEESQHLRVNDNGELEVPYIGLVPAQGRTCRELAYAIKASLEKEYYYHATVILAIERVSEKSRGRIYVYGSVKGQGPQEIPADESYTEEREGFYHRFKAGNRRRTHGRRHGLAAGRSDLRPATAD
jgi:protein involved in polysaccharide export with SLBB domain